MWALSLLMLFAATLVLHEVNINHIESHTIKSITDVLIKPFWALGLAFVIYSCTSGYGGENQMDEFIHFFFHSQFNPGFSIEQGNTENCKTFKLKISRQTRRIPFVRMYETAKKPQVYCELYRLSDLKLNKLVGIFEGKVPAPAVYFNAKKRLLEEKLKIVSPFF